MSFPVCSASDLPLEGTFVGHLSKVILFLHGVLSRSNSDDFGLSLTQRITQDPQASTKSRAVSHGRGATNPAPRQFLARGCIDNLAVSTAR